MSTGECVGGDTLKKVIPSYAPGVSLMQLDSGDGLTPDQLASLICRCIGCGRFFTRDAFHRSHTTRCVVGSTNSV